MRRHDARRLVWLVIAVMTVSGAAAAAPQSADEALSTSLLAEQAGNFGQARSALVQTFGETPDRYDVCMRLAWISMRLKDGPRAAALYRHARTLDGAGEGASEGLVSALTLVGYQALERGELAAARHAWEEAVSLDATASDAMLGLDRVGRTHTGGIDLWGAQLSARASSVAVSYAQLHGRLSPELSLRAGFRRIGAAPAVGTTAPLFGGQTELFGGASVDRGVATVDVVALSLGNTLERVSGVAAAVRVGGRYGASLTASGLHGSSGWNGQTIVQGFAWVTPMVAMTGGVRATRDPSLSATSALVGLAFRNRRASVDVLLHTGPERWAFSMAGPSVLSFADRTTSGVTITVGAPLSRLARAWVQGQHERLASPDGATADGSYRSIAAGVSVTFDRRGKP